MQPRREQPSITIRSTRAVERLKLLTKDGRSQAEVIEEALDRMPEPRPGGDEQKRWNQIMEILDRIDTSSIPTMAEFDRQEYDENGLPR